MIGRKATRVRLGMCTSALARVVGIVSLTGDNGLPSWELCARQWPTFWGPASMRVRGRVGQDAITSAAVMRLPAP